MSQPGATTPSIRDLTGLQRPARRACRSVRGSTSDGRSVGPWCYNRTRGNPVTYPASPYIEQRNGGLYLAGTGISLDSIIIRFQEGASPARIVDSFPTLKLAQVYRAIAYYVENEQAISAYIAEGVRELERSRASLSQTRPELFSRLESARHQLGSKHS